MKRNGWWKCKDYVGMTVMMLVMKMSEIEGIRGCLSQNIFCSFK